MTKTSENREKIAAALLADSGRHDREIARAIGCSHRTVAAIRTKMAASGQIVQPPRPKRPSRMKSAATAAAAIINKAAALITPTATGPQEAATGPQEPRSVGRRLLNAVGLARSPEPPRVSCPSCGCEHYVDGYVGNRPRRICRHCGRPRPAERRPR